MLATLAASRGSSYPRTKQLLPLLLLLLSCFHQSRHASAVQHQTLVSLPSQLHRKRSPTVSMLQNQHLRARNSTTRDERSKSCDCWMRHMHDAWQQKKQLQPLASKGQLTLDSRWHLFLRSVS